MNIYTIHRLAYFIGNSFADWTKSHLWCCRQHTFAAQLSSQCAGEVPKRVIPANLKGAEVQALVHDPILGEACPCMLLYDGLMVSPIIQHTPQHKGKVESGVHYVKRKFMACQEFVDIHVGNLHLRDWILNTVEVCKHGTTNEAQLQMFNEIEKACLQPLPPQTFQLLEIRLVKVHPDRHVMITGSFYSVPFEFVSQELSVHVCVIFVEIYKGQDLARTRGGICAITCLAFQAILVSRYPVRLRGSTILH